MRLMTIPALLLLLAASFPSAHAQSGFAAIAKDVAAPPSDILSGRVVLPDVRDTAVESPVQIRAVEPAWNASTGWGFETDVFVDADGALAVALLSPTFTDWSWRFVGPDGVELDLDSLRARGLASRDARDRVEADSTWSADGWSLAAVRAGTWRVRLHAEGPTRQDSPARADAPASGWLIARTDGPARLVVHASTLATRSDVPVGVVARFEGARTIGTRGTVVAELATGTVRLELFDDGLHADGAAGDGTFGALLPPWTSGDVRVRVDLAGDLENGSVLARTANLAFPVIERRTLLTGGVDTSLDEQGRVRIALDALAAGSGAKFLVAGEVWGTAANGALAPVAWLARMQQPREQNGEIEFALALDVRWIQRANARAPFVLRRVRVQDPDTLVPHDLVDEIAFDMPALPLPDGADPIAITQDMLQGSGILAQPTGPHARATAILQQPALLLVHGYCSGGSIWPAADFTQPKLEFLDPNANRTHDQFAMLMLQTTNSLTSFGVLAHSQGGMAALHLYTYYASGLDAANGPRLIQSVCSPYLGTPLASLGGFSCGVNNDMTTSGGPMWLAGIPTWARSNVYYWTTSNSGSACNFFASLLLDDPEDGTVEMIRGQLVGGNSMGHVVGWCHTTGMSNPAAYTDHARNVERNAQSAR